MESNFQELHLASDCTEDVSITTGCEKQGTAFSNRPLNHIHPTKLQKRLKKKVRELHQINQSPYFIRPIHYHMSKKEKEDHFRNNTTLP